MGSLTLPSSGPIYLDTNGFIYSVERIEPYRTLLFVSKINIEYTVQVWQEGNQYIAHAMPLDVMSSGPTPDEARTAMDEAVYLFLVTAKHMDTPDDILVEAGYTLREENWVSPVWIATERRTTEVGVS